MLDIRECRVADLPFVQQLNIMNLPENYPFKYYLYHLISWPHASWVAEINGNIIGYVLAKMYKLVYL